MIHIDAIHLHLILETLLLVSIALGICIYKQRRGVHSLKTCRKQAAELAKRRDLYAYLAQEIAQCQEYVGQLERNKTDTSVPNIRKLILTLEQQLSTLPTHDEVYWKLHANAIAHVLDEHCPAQAARDEVKRDQAIEPDATTLNSDEINITEIVEDLISKITYVREMAAEVIPEESVKERINLALDTVTRTGRELSSCIYILEDENGFLRDQVAALLKIS